MINETKRYDKKKIKKELEQLRDKLTASEKALIAGVEECTTATVQNYLNGSVGVYALAEAIVRRGKLLINSRK